jgi:hypothetical protein
MEKNSLHFEGPERRDELLWKYLDFTKFASLINSASLYFARADQLLDPYEGSYPLTDHHQIRKQVFLNCWHQSEYESAAMWELYSQKNEGMAIVSTFDKLEASFANGNDYKIHFGKINYIDYSGIDQPSSDPIKPFAYKRKSFEHEKEVRAIIHCKNQDKCRYKGIFIPIDINKVIKHIYVAPYTEDWIVDLVNNLLNKFDLRVPVTKSRLYDSSEVLGR